MPIDRDAAAGARTIKASEFKARPKTFFGRDRDRIRILGDIVSPMPAEWFDDGGDSGEDLF